MFCSPHAHPPSLNSITSHYADHIFLARTPASCLCALPKSQPHLTDSFLIVPSLLQSMSAVSFNSLISGGQERYRRPHAARHSIQTSPNTPRLVLSNVLLSVDIWATVKQALSAEGGEEQVALSPLSTVSPLAPVMEINEVSGE